MITATLVAVGASLIWMGRMLKAYEDRSTSWAESLINNNNNNNSSNKGAHND